MKGDNGTNNFNTTRVRCGGKKKNQSIENVARKTADCDGKLRTVVCCQWKRSDEHDGEETIAVGEEHSERKKSMWRQFRETLHW
jgi:hypothetical protein